MRFRNRAIASVTFMAAQVEIFLQKNKILRFCCFAGRDRATRACSNKDSSEFQKIFAALPRPHEAERQR